MEAVRLIPEEIGIWGREEFTVSKRTLASASGERKWWVWFILSSGVGLGFFFFFSFFFDE